MSQPDYYYSLRKDFDKVIMDAFIKGIVCGIFICITAAFLLVIGMMFSKGVQP